MPQLHLIDASQPTPKGAGPYLAALPGGLVLGGLYLARLYSYLLFHSLVEILSVGVAFSVFTVFWNSRRFVTNGIYLFLGIAYVGVALFDLLHTLAYDGMGVFQGYGANLPTQLWIAGRSLEAVSWLVAPLFLGRRPNAYVVLGISGGILALLLGMVFLGAMPACYVEGSGLTTFKKVSEYVISAMLVAALAQLYRRRDQLDPDVHRLLAISLLVTIVSELSFTLYTDVYGMANLVGHFLKLISYYLIYKAFVEVALTEPFALLFRDLKRNESELKALNETLEARVAQRTAVAEQRAVQLRALAAELTRAEQRERRRLAQLLHDHLQQLLFAAKLNLARLERHVADEKVRGSLAQIDDILQESIAASRSLTVELSPPILYDAGLAPALEWLARRMHEQHGLTVIFEADKGLGPVGDETAAVLFQAVRELLFNVVKHAQTDSALVQLSGEGESVSILVADRGAGFDPAEAERRSRSGGSFGLFSMRERMELIGGRMLIDSSPGKGTHVTITACRTVEPLRDSSASITG